MFHQGDLQSGIGLAVQQSKAVLCFIQDDTDASAQWEEILKDDSLSSAIAAQTIALRLQAGSQEAAFLQPIAPIQSTPAVIVIKNAQLQANIQAGQTTPGDLKTRLLSLFGIETEGNTEASQQEHVGRTDATTEQTFIPSSSIQHLDLQPAPGQMRLPNNAYDALRNHTQKLLDEGNSSAEVFQTQLSLMNNISIFHDEVSRLRSSTAPPELSEYARSRLLRLPAVGLKIPGLRKSSAAAPSSSHDAPVPSSSSSQPAPTTTSMTSPPPNLPQSQPPTAITTTSSNPATSSQPKVGSKSDPDKQKAQRAEYIKLQREREQKARDERERVKAQIKADREERRRLDDLRKGILPPGDSTTASSSYARSQRPNNSEIRIQVRTFDGSTLRSTFAPSATLSTDVRPWINSTTENTIPYNLKLILTPSPIRSIEASEEELTLSDLGIVGSCTLVMAPVKGYVESYTGSSAGGMLSSAVSGGYNLVSGTAGFVFGGVKNILGYGQPSDAPSSSSSSSVLGGGGPGSESGSGPSDRDVAKVRVRTLADQRAEAAKRGNQFYNGNQLNFEPKKKDDDEDDGNG
ncbi:hypothetical protein PV10_05214 [Exophiala mesophila]|uniref:UBX domain-containing protein n=1 Tax=Exophiala mesophila TaxID=212818 RepID=A0A0D1ZHH9_EXOME|nr:uncharacterized protein PV10_05214 [Exophiala mesophila]KIV94057.1 hypothetical protein PV10_05214 [Exophiala mesophila]